MRNKKIIVFFITLFSLNAFILTQEKTTQEEIYNIQEEVCNIENEKNDQEVVTDLDIEKSLTIEDQVLNLDYFLQEFMLQNKNFLEKQKHLFIKRLTKEGSMVVPLFILLGLFLYGPTSEYFKNWYNDVSIPFSQLINENFKDKQISVIAIPSIISAFTYILIRALYFGQKTLSKNIKINLDLLTKFSKNWPKHKNKVAIELHGLFDQLHEQYLNNAKLNLTELQAQEVVSKLIKMGFKHLEEDIKIKLKPNK
ncbi:hypothetical protein GF322_02520 [Candidatus Dependentiae bacterium]|nr:hypothetical protein [Candidatus Dependentiae bacterium]